MKELELYEVLPLIWEELGKTSISVYELNMWAQGYEAENKDIYISRTRVDIHHAHGCNYIWFEINHEGSSDILHKQERVQCSICGDWHYKYPDTEKFDLIVKQLDNLKQLENIWSSK